MSELEARGRCPVCRASLRDSPECFRCGADLAPLFVIEKRAAAFRRLARSHLEQGAYAAARDAAAEAQLLCRTPEGAALLLTVTLLSDITSEFVGGAR